MKDFNGFNFQQLNQSDYIQLNLYLDRLDPLTKSRFQPHLYDIESINKFYSPDNYNQGFVVYLPDKQTIIGYAIIHYGFLLHDAPRLTSYGIELNHSTDCVFAPSVADAWQGQGLGKQLLDYVLAEIKSRSFKRIFLWGGVQAENPNALKFYNKSGFIPIGTFNHQGLNYDMMKEIS
jgi:GNAT superfamily N-acetyltransferase